MTTNTKIMIAVVVLGAGAAFLYTRRKTAAASGSVTADATRETYYGASGRCFQHSDDTEVPAARCTDRGIPIGIPKLPDIIGWFSGVS